MLALGSFPAVSLASARDRRDEAKKLIAAGTDPADKRKLDKLASEVANRNTFGATAAVIDSQSVKSAEKVGPRLICRVTTRERRSRARSGTFL
jgi:hypothetical protein